MEDALDRFRRSLSAVLRALPLALDESQLALLERHFELLLRWNRKLNLTSLHDPAQIARRHFGESLLVASALPADAGMLADIGSGAGFPGVPVAVARPRMQVSLVESVGKKAVFLQEVTRPLPNAHVLHGRFEQMPICFPWAVMRGVAAGPLRAAISERVQNLALLTGKTEGPDWIQIQCPWDPQRILLLGRPPRGPLTARRPETT